MTYYFWDLSFRILILKLTGRQVYLFKRSATVSIWANNLSRIPILNNIFDNFAQEPEAILGQYPLLWFQIENESIECFDQICNKLKLEDCLFIKIYNEKFKTAKFKPFVLKWLSTYVTEMLDCLYRIHFDTAPIKVLLLRNNPLNRYIYEWWHQKTGKVIQIKWLAESEVGTGLEAVVAIGALFVYNLFQRGLCLPAKPKKFKIMKEAVWGLTKPSLRDDFLVDSERLMKTDLLLFACDLCDKRRILAYKEAQNRGYESVNISNLKIPIDLLWRILKYHLLLPIGFVLKSCRDKRNYMLKEWLKFFHAAAFPFEVLLSHYQVGLCLQLDDAPLFHIPQTIVLNNCGTKSVGFQYSDLSNIPCFFIWFKSFNVDLTWGRAHSGQRLFVDDMIEIGCCLKHNLGKLTENKKAFYQRIGIPDTAGKVVAFYDESFNPHFYFTEETLLDFWQMMAELIEENEDIIGLMKTKHTDEERLAALSDKGRSAFLDIKQRCLRSGRIYILNPLEVDAMEVIAISDININMGMATPVTMALLCGKIGLYYETSGVDYHPFCIKYRGKIVFDNKETLFSTVDKIAHYGYNPLKEIEEELLRDCDSYRDYKGLERFRDVLLSYL